MRLVILAAVWALAAGPGLAVERSDPPPPRPSSEAGRELALAQETPTEGATTTATTAATATDATAATAAPRVQPARDFAAWVRGFRGRALAQGISENTFRVAFSGVRYNADIVAKDRNQAEFTKQIWEYLATAVSPTRIKNGRDALARHARVLAEIEARYGVEKEVVAAIWGLESAYGTFRGATPVIEALASLAYDPRRGAFFEEQLVAALKILEAGDARPAALRGSWAGAMGHTQFMPGSFLEHGQDFDGDGRRNIWGEDPTDALASAAAYLRANGWTTGQPWGFEVTLPEGFDYALSTERVKRPAQFWADLGVARAGGGEIPNHPGSSILLPAGHKGPAFLIYPNFQVIETYNTADAYVIGVGHLADRIAGGAPIAARWPLAERALSFGEKQELQERLQAAGFDPEAVDGIVGPLTIAAVQDYQASIGWVPDGYVSAAVLERLREDG